MKPPGTKRPHLAYGARLALVNVALAAGLLAAPVGAAEPKTLLLLGDSLTAGYGLPAEDGFAAQLETALEADGMQVRVINAGVSGDTTSGGLARLDWALGDDPDAVVVELGANDGLRGIDPAITKANLDTMLTKLAAKEVPTLFTGMLAPPNLGREYGAEFNRLFPDLAERHGVAFYPFFLDGVAARPDLNQADGIHPNADGVAIIVARILPHVKRLLAP